MQMKYLPFLESLGKKENNYGWSFTKIVIDSLMKLPV